MTSDQVLLDDAAATDASATTTKPKTVRRRTTKKTEAAAPSEVETPLAEQPTLPAIADGDAPTPESDTAKPKRTRTVKPKTTDTTPKTTATKTRAKKADSAPTSESESETASPLSTGENQNGYSSDSNSNPANVDASPAASDATPARVESPVVAEGVQSAPNNDVQAQMGSTEVASPNSGDILSTAEAQTSSPTAEAPVRPSVPARFPSRFKRVHRPEPEAAPVQESSTDASASPAQEPPVAEAPTSETTSQASETTEPSLPGLETSTEATPEGGISPVEAGTTAEGSTATETGEDGPPSTSSQGQEGGFASQDGEMPEGGFGRMRYRERREFRRQQRMQQRQERFGNNGEPLPQQGQGFSGQQGFNGQNAPNAQQGFNGPNGQQGFNGRPGFNQGGYQPQPRRREYDFFTLQSLSEEDLNTAAQEYGVDMEVERDRDELVMAVMEAQARAQNSVLKTGILDAHDHNKAFLRCEGYTPSENDVYVSQTQIKRFNLKTGDVVFGTARAPKENERFFGLLRVESINGLSPEELRHRKDFEKLTPIFPDSRYHLETDQGNITARIIDLVSPIGKGQRGLVVAPPKAGKTTLLKNIANSITRNNPEAELFVLLIDERPEEVTDISRNVRGEVVASTFDEMPENHMRVADIVMERAKRLVEMKRDVVILLDSITRLSRASNLVVTPSGRTLSGGLDPAAMYRPKRMFGAARNIEEGGSLTILATALVDTGSRMDEMIFEEFKGTGNMDLVLDRDLFNQRIFPAIDINKSGTRRDDLLMSKDELAATFHLRQTLARLDNDQAVKLMIDRLKNTKSNSDFMTVVAKSARQAELKAAAN